MKKYETQIDFELSEVIFIVRGKAEPSGVAPSPPPSSEANKISVVGNGKAKPTTGDSRALSSLCLS